MSSAQGTRGKYLAFVAFMSFAATAGSQPWTSNWTVPGPQAFVYPFASSGVAFEPDGDVVIGAVSATHHDYQFTRTSPTGEWRWTINLGGYYANYDELNAVFALADNSTLVGFGADASASLVRVEADGTPAWSRRVLADSIQTSVSGSVIASGCATYTRSGAVTKIDAQSGTIAWQLFYPAPACPSSMLTDATGSVYVISGPQWAISKLGPNGTIIWTQGTPNGESVSLVGTDGSNVYVAGQHALRALHAEDGGTAWDHAYPDGVTATFIPGASPVVRSGYVLERLATADGAAQWSTPLSAPCTPQVTLDAIICLGYTSTLRVDALTGEQLWSKPAPTDDGYGNYVSPVIVGPGGAGTLLNVGSASSFGAHGPVIQPQNLDTGNVLAPLPIPTPAQGVTGWSTVANATHIVGAGVTLGATSPDIHVRRVNSLDGAQDWDTTEHAIADAIPNSWGYTPDYVTLATDSSSVAVVAAENSWTSQGTFGLAWAGMYDITTGARRWSADLRDSYQRFTRYTSVGDQPLIMSNGDVVFAVGAPIVSNFGDYPQVNTAQQTVLRLSAADGHVIWRRDATLGGATVYDTISPPGIVAIGDDIVVTGPFETAPALSAFVRLSGATGTTVWASTVLAADHPSLLLQSGGKLMVYGYNAWAKVDPDTGAALWTASSNNACDQLVFCNGYGRALLPDGDLLSVGEGSYAPLVTRLRGDGSGIQDIWSPEAPVQNFRSIVLDLAVDAAGTPWVRVSRSFRDAYAGLNFLAQFDPATGNILDQQVIGYFVDNPLSPARHASIIAAPQNNRLPVNNYIVDSPSPQTSGNAMIDTTVSATGDLSAQVIADASKVNPGDSLPFHFIAAYSGDNPLAGVRLLGLVPWGSGVENVSCSGQGVSNCVVRTNAGAIEASFDLAPGSQVDIAGLIKVLPWPDTPRNLHAMVWGPVGLSESETLNNFARATVTQSLFFDGFE